jgi:Zn-dependent protease with chaperone function
VHPNRPQRRLIEADIARFVQQAPVPAGVTFQVLDCEVDGFVYRGRSIVISSRLARLPAAQRFFILAHELGHLRMQHHNAVLNFVARVVRATPDESAARAAVTSGLAAISYQAELEADAFAVRLMKDAGLDGEEAARLFDSLGEGEDSNTHPSAGKRARAIRNLL